MNQVSRFVVLAFLAAPLLQDSSYAGTINVVMYSLPAKGAEPRVGVGIAVDAFFTTPSGDDRVADTAGPPIPQTQVQSAFSRTGTASLTIPDELYFNDARQPLNNFPVTLRFSIDRAVVQTVLGAMVPRRGTVELHVAVPDQPPLCQSQNLDCAQPGCFVRRHHCRLLGR